MSEGANEYLVILADAVRERFTSALVGQPEDQLKTPVENLFRNLGRQFGYSVQVTTEATAAEVGRPDIAVAVDREKDFCMAFARDRDTGQRYWLVDPPGIE